MHICTCMHPHTCTTHIYTHIYIYTYMPTPSSIHTMHTSIYSCICLYPYTLAYAHAHTCIHTHIHTHAHKCIIAYMHTYKQSRGHNWEEQKCNVARKTVEPGKPYSIETQQRYMGKACEAGTCSTEARLVGSALKGL